MNINTSYAAYDDKKFDGFEYKDTKNFDDNFPKPFVKSRDNDKFFNNLMNESRQRQNKRLENLRYNHAKQRASLAMRYGTMPRYDMYGGMTAPDFYDDGLINGSAPHINSQYMPRRNLPLYYDSPVLYGLPKGIINS